MTLAYHAGLGPGRRMVAVTLNDPWNVVAYRVFPAVQAVTLLMVAYFSRVNSLLLFSGPGVTAVTVVYAAILVWLAVFPGKVLKLHAWGNALAVLILGGRALGFVELMIEQGSWALAGTVAERVINLLALLLWHRSGIIHAGRLRTNGK